MKAGVDRILRPEQAAYLSGLDAPRDALLARMEAHAAASGQPISDPEVATLLRLLCAMHKPRRIVEIGCNIGYGAVVLGRAAPPGATVDTVEIDDGLASQARTFIAEAGLEASVRVHTQGALEFLDAMGPGVDFAYIDCVKEDYPAYLERLAKVMGKGSVVVADNVLWRGHVASDPVPDTERARTLALRRFNEQVTSPPWDGVILPLGDGVAVAVKTA